VSALTGDGRIRLSPMKVLLAVVVACAAIVIAFEADDVANGEVMELSTADLTTPDFPPNIVLLQDSSGKTPMGDENAQMANETAKADTVESEAEDMENTAGAQSETANDAETTLKGQAGAAEHEEQQSQEEEDEAEKEEKDADEKERTAEDNLKKAEKDAKDAKQVTGADGLLVQTDGTKLSAAEKKAADEEKAVTRATAEAKKHKIEMEEATQKYHKSQHKLDLLTGVAKKGESFEAYLERKAQEARLAQRGAAGHLNAAEATLRRAKAEQSAAEEAKKLSEAKVSALSNKADEKKKAAEELEAKLQEAIANGTATADMFAKAKAARAEATKAAAELHHEQGKLEKLNDVLTKATEAASHALKKKGALQKLKGAEEQLVRDMNNKLRDADTDLDTMKAASHDAKVLEIKAMKEEEKMKTAFNKAHDELSGFEGEAKQKELKLEAVEVKLDADRKAHLDLSEEVKTASGITIAEDTPVEEAKALLIKKESQLSALTKQLLGAIGKEKAIVTEKHELIKQHAKVMDEIGQATTKVAEAAAAAQAAKFNAGNATLAKNAAVMKVQNAENNVTKDENAQKSAANQLESVGKKEEAAEEEAADLKTKEETVEGEKDDVETEKDAAEKDAEKAEEDTEALKNSPVANGVTEQ